MPKPLFVCTLMNNFTLHSKRANGSPDARLSETSKTFSATSSSYKIQSVESHSPAFILSDSIYNMQWILHSTSDLTTSAAYTYLGTIVPTPGDHTAAVVAVAALEFFVILGLLSCYFLKEEPPQTLKPKPWKARLPLSPEEEVERLEAIIKTVAEGRKSATTAATKAHERAEKITRELAEEKRRHEKALDDLRADQGLVVAQYRKDKQQWMKEEKRWAKVKKDLLAESEAARNAAEEANYCKTFTQMRYEGAAQEAKINWKHVQLYYKDKEDLRIELNDTQRQLKDAKYLAERARESLRAANEKTFELETKLAVVERRHDESQKQLEIVGPSRLDAASQLKALQTELTSLKQNNDIQQQATAELEATKKKLAVTEKSLEQYQDAPSIAEVEKLRSGIENAQDALTSAKNDVENAKKDRMTDMSTLRHYYAQKLETVTGERDAAKRSLTGLEDKISKLEENHQQDILAANREKDTVLTQYREEANQLVISHNKEVADLNEQLASAKEEATKVKEENKQLSTANEKTEKVKEELNGALANVKEELRKVKEELNEQRTSKESSMDQSSRTEPKTTAVLQPMDLEVAAPPASQSIGSGLMKLDPEFKFGGGGLNAFDMRTEQSSSFPNAIEQPASFTLYGGPGSLFAAASTASEQAKQKNAGPDEDFAMDDVENEASHSTTAQGSLPIDSSNLMSELPDVPRAFGREPETNEVNSQPKEDETMCDDEIGSEEVSSGQAWPSTYDPSLVGGGPGPSSTSPQAQEPSFEPAVKGEAHGVEVLTHKCPDCGTAKAEVGCCERGCPNEATNDYEECGECGAVDVQMYGHIGICSRERVNADTTTRNDLYKDTPDIFRVCGCPATGDHQQDICAFFAQVPDADEKDEFDDDEEDELEFEEVPPRDNVDVPSQDDADPTPPDVVESTTENNAGDQATPPTQKPGGSEGQQTANDGLPKCAWCHRTVTEGHGPNCQSFTTNDHPTAENRNGDPVPDSAVSFPELDHLPNNFEQYGISDEAILSASREYSQTNAQAAGDESRPQEDEDQIRNENQDDPAGQVGASNWSNGNESSELSSAPDSADDHDPNDDLDEIARELEDGLIAAFLEDSGAEDRPDVVQEGDTGEDKSEPKVTKVEQELRQNHPGRKYARMRQRRPVKGK